MRGVFFVGLVIKVLVLLSTMAKSTNSTTSLPTSRPASVAYQAMDLPFGVLSDAWLDTLPPSSSGVVAVLPQPTTSPSSGANVSQPGSLSAPNGTAGFVPTRSPSIAPTVPPATILSSLQFYDTLSSSSHPRTRIDHVDQYSPINATESSVAHNLTICHLVDLNFHSFTTTQGLRIPHPSSFGPQAVAAYALALEHLNARDDSVISELADLQCGQLQFTAEFFDTALREYLAVDAVTQTLERSRRRPCVFTGASYSSVTMASAVVTGVHGYPQVSAMSVAAQLEDRQQFPLFARLAARSGSEAAPLLDLLYHEFRLDFLTVVYTDEPETLTVINRMGKLVFDAYPDLQLRFVAIPSDASDFVHTVDEIKQKGSRYVLSALSQIQFEPFILEAYEQGIIGDEQHVWVVLGNSLQNIEGEFSPQDPFFRAMKGIVRFTASGSVPNVGRHSSFVEAWEKLRTSPGDLAYLQSLLPILPENALESKNTIDHSTFEVLNSFTPLVYDMAILVGMAACQAGGSFTGEEHYQAILNTTFVGATGNLALDPATGSRAEASFIGSLFNVRPYGLENGNYSLSAVRVGNYADSRWTMDSMIIFNDGTTNFPSVLPPLHEDHNYIGRSLRLSGYALAGTVILCSVAASFWTAHGREKSRVIIASQPIFLLWITVGTALMGASIIPLAMDDEVSAQPPCMAPFWLFTLGWCFAFSALFSKTRRVNMIFHNPRFTRIKVSACDVILPMACLLAGTFVLQFVSFLTFSEHLLLSSEQ